jgi:tetratricopeptide (TPR) repeat protein
MYRMCNNESWLAAYLDGSLSEAERLEVDAHLSRCPQCLTDLIAAKADLDDVLAEIAAEERQRAKSPASVSSPARVGIRWARLFGLLAPTQGPSARVASPAAFIVSAALAVGFFVLMLSPNWDPNVIVGRTSLTSILASADTGDMLLSNAPRIPRTEGVSFRGTGESRTSLFAQAERELTSARADYGNGPLVNSLLGDFYVAKGEINMAELTYRRGLHADDPDARLLNGLAVAAFRRGEPAQSRDYLERALRCEHVPAEIYYNLAQLSKNASDIAQYKRYLALYLQKDSSSPLAKQVKQMLAG